MGDRAVDFVAEDRRPATVEAVHPDSLHPKLKALLFLPDLVTEFLEAAFHETISVSCLSQATRDDVADVDLGVTAGDVVVLRVSEIQGATTGRTFVRADVCLRAGGVPGEMVEEMADRSAGLGRLLDRYGVRHEREMLWYGREGDEVIRKYRLVGDGGSPFATIVERFPIDLFGRCPATDP